MDDFCVLHFYNPWNGKAKRKRFNMQKESVQNQITEGVIWKQLLIFFFPIAMGTIFQQFYNVADAVIVGRFVGKAALASVGGSAGLIVNIVVGFFSGLTVGASVIISQNYGAKDRTGVQKGLHTAYCFSIITGVILSVAGFCSAPWFLRIMNTPADILADSILYLRIYFVGLTAVLVYNMGSSIMRAIGDSRRPLYILVACSLLNIVLDILFIVTFHMGIAGAAAATVISQLVSALIVTGSLMKSYADLTLVLSEIRIDMRVLASELKIGLPGGLQFCISGFTNIILQTAINGFGTDTTAAWAAFNKMDMIFWTICGAFGASVTTFAGQNYGAKKLDRVFHSVRVCLALSVISCGAIQILLMVFARPLFYIFVTDNQVIEIGVSILRFLVPSYILFVFIEIPAGALRGIGDAARPTAINMMGVLLIRLLWILFVVPKYHKLSTILISYPIAGMFSVVLMIIYYLYKKKILRKQWDM